MVNEIKAPASAVIDDDDDTRRRENTISGAGSDLNTENASMKERFSIARFISQLRDDRAKVAATGAFNKQLEMSDFYSRSRRGGQVHYQEKTTSKTHFVDKGNSIEVKRDAVKSESVGVALELARAKFGSTLNVKGSREFKELAIQAALEKNMDVRFTDKAMNNRLEQLKAAVAKAAGASTGTETAATDEYGTPLNRPDQKAAAMTLLKDVIAREQSSEDSDPDYVGKRVEEILQHPSQQGKASVEHADIGEDPADPDYLGRLAEEQYNQNYGMD